jgi:hypothetical protein
VDLVGREFGAVTASVGHAMGVEVGVDWASAAAAGADERSPVSVTFARATTLAEVLDAIAAGLPAGNGRRVDWRIVGRAVRFYGRVAGGATP